MDSERTFVSFYDGVHDGKMPLPASPSTANMLDLVRDLGMYSQLTCRIDLFCRPRVLFFMVELGVLGPICPRLESSR